MSVNAPPERGTPLSAVRRGPPEPDETPFNVVRPGTVDYQEAWDLQKELADLRRSDRVRDTLLLLEHPHTYTLGRRGNEENILLSARQLERRGIDVYRVDRGGDVTYHGPGQLVGYPLLKLPAGRLDYVRYIRDVEAALLLAVRDLGIAGELKNGFSGVWVGDDKLCAIGVKIDSAGVTTHGFALNVDPDMSYFSHIVPCGLVDKGVTSLKAQLGKRPPARVVERSIIHRLAERFGLRPRAIGPRAFEASLRRPPR